MPAQIEWSHIGQGFRDFKEWYVKYQSAVRQQQMDLKAQRAQMPRAMSKTKDANGAKKEDTPSPEGKAKRIKPTKVVEQLAAEEEDLGSMEIPPQASWTEAVEEGEEAEKEE